MKKKNVFFSLMIGNILEHYDSAIFGLLSPFIASVFFDDKDPLVALMLTYLMIPLGLLIKPLGSVIFGRIGDLKGRSYALSISLVGMAISTVGIGCLPSYKSVGVLSPILLFICRLAQGFFAAGETSGGAIYLLEKSDEKKSDLMSSLFDSSTIIGIFLASLIVTLFAKFQLIEGGWRTLFWLGGAAAFFGALLRRSSLEKESSESPHHSSLFKAIKNHKSAFFSIVITAGFSQVTYIFPIVFMAGFIPLVSPLTKEALTQMNTQLLLLDLILLPIFGLVAEKLGRELLMRSAALLSAILVPTAFFFCDRASMIHVMGLRSLVVTLGVAFSASYHAYAVASLPYGVRYTLMSIGVSLGSLLIGKPIAAISLALYQWTGSPFSAVLCFLLVALLTTLSLWPKRRADHVFAS